MTKLAAYYYCWQARLRDREEGQALVEYALILALIAVFAIASLRLLGQDVDKILSSIASALGGVAGS
jgi:pilus assembly protein Flp/PilA